MSDASKPLLPVQMPSSPDGSCHHIDHLRSSDAPIARTATPGRNQAVFSARQSRIEHRNRLSTAGGITIDDRRMQLFGVITRNTVSDEAWRCGFIPGGIDDNDRARLRAVKHCVRLRL